jgi:hypothetical protein
MPLEGRSARGPRGLRLHGGRPHLFPELPRRLPHPKHVPPHALARFRREHVPSRRWGRGRRSECGELYGCGRTIRAMASGIMIG